MGVTLVIKKEFLINKLLLMLNSHNRFMEVHMIKRRRLWKIILILAFILSFVTPVLQEANQITAYAATYEPSLSESKKTLYVGYNTYSIKIKNLSKTAKVTYKTSNKKVATVSKKGKVTPLATGSAKITVSISQNNKTYKCYLNITVKEPYIKITEKPSELKVGESFKLAAKVYGSKQKLKWKVSDSKIAKIDAGSGVITAKAAGKVTVTAYAGELKKTFKITVSEPENRELIIDGNSEMVVGETIIFAVTNANEDKNLEWSVSNSNAKCSDVYGNEAEITALKPGKVKVKVKSANGYGEKTIEIKDLKIQGNNTLSVGEIAHFTLNSEQAYFYVYWTVEDQTVAEIVEETDGVKVAGLSEGSTVLTANYSWNSNVDDFKVNIPINVKNTPDFSISGDTVIEAGNSKTYKISLSQNYSVAWTSSDYDVASVEGSDNTAVVTAWKPGTIILKAEIGRKQAQIVITVIDSEQSNEDNTPDVIIIGGGGGFFWDTGNSGYNGGGSVIWDSGDSGTSGNTGGSSGNTGNTGNAGNTGNTDNSADTGNTDNSGKKPDSSKQVVKNGIIYELTDNGAYVVGLEKGTSHAEILSEVNGIPVVRICRSFGENRLLKSVSWSGKTITLEPQCFFMNTSLTSVSLHGGDIYIESAAFSDCYHLTNVSLSGEVKKVGNGAFSACSSLTELTIPGTETIYGYKPFWGCSSLKDLRLESKVILDDGVDELYLFSGMSGHGSDPYPVEYLYLNIEQITDYRMFTFMEYLRKLTLVNTKSIDSQLCDNFEYLEEVVLPDTLTVIPKYAFTSCDNLRKVTIPKSVVKIENFAFAYCGNLAEIDAEFNPNREINVEYAFFKTPFDTVQGCYLNNAVNVLSLKEYTILQKALSVLETVKANGADEYNIIKGCHDWIILNTVYDYDSYYKSLITSKDVLEIPGSPEGVFINGTAVCDGYAKSFKLLMDLAGIECYRVIGDVIYSNEGHAWNIVKLNGEYYQVDCTWDDPDTDDNSIIYDYFLISDSKMAKDHIWDQDAYIRCPNDYTADDELLGA